MLVDFIWLPAYVYAGPPRPQHNQTFAAGLVRVSFGPFVSPPTARDLSLDRTAGDQHAGGGATATGWGVNEGEESGGNNHKGRR